jgi:hypothetical protein
MGIAAAVGSGREYAALDHIPSGLAWKVAAAVKKVDDAHEVMGFA